jgi:hypothetical protein
LAPLAPFTDRFVLANLWLMKPFVLRQMEAVAGFGGHASHHDLATIMNRRRQGQCHSADRPRRDQFPAAPRDTVQSVTAHVKGASAMPKSTSPSARRRSRKRPRLSL